MRYELTGVSIPMGGIQWQKTTGDREVARTVVTFLEDRRLLFGDRHVEDEGHCVASALEIRAFLTEQITSSKPGRELEGCLRSMRGACRRFIDAGGPHGQRFLRSQFPYEADGFSLALGDLRTTVGFQLAIILSQYNLPIEPELGSILPPADEDDQDLSWMIGFQQ